jgi:spermidine synthase
VRDRRLLRASLLAFLTAFVTLFVQVLVHRMISAKLVNNYAFLVISLTMLGLAISGVILSRALPLFQRNWSDAAVCCAALFALSLVLASALFYRAPFDYGGTPSRLAFAAGFLRFMPLALLYAVPFTFCGLILGGLLSAPDLPVGRVYFSDLVGSAAGAFAVIPAIASWGAERSALAGAAALLTGALFLEPPRRVATWLLAGASAITLAAGFVAPDRVFAMRYPRGTFLALTQVPGSALVLEHVAWDPVARIEVTRITPPDPATGLYACLIGSRRAFHERFQRVITQNNNAYTYAVAWDGKRESLDGIDETLYAAGYQVAPEHPRVLVIGVGGGFDLLTALYHDAASVTGVEVNAATVDVLRRAYASFFAPWVTDPRVRLVVDEGRRYLASRPETYDLVQLSGVDSASGTPAAAHVFSESYLYTREAFDLYLSRLRPDGVLCMMRLEWNPPREMLRAVVTAKDALRRAGVAHPEEQMATVTSTAGDFAALLVKRRPFRPAELDRLRAWSSPSPYFRISAAPGDAAAGPSAYASFVSLPDARSDRRWVAEYPFDVRPVDDDRPFFFRFSFWSDLLPGGFVSLPIMELSLVLLALLVSGAAVLCVYLPLRLLAAPGARFASAGRYAVFFAGLGLGFLAIEVALLQKFGLFLGHPNYALSVVLAALLLTSGLGSLLSPVLLRVPQGVQGLSLALVATVLVEHFVALPFLPSLVAWPFAARASLTFVLVAPIGLLLGAFLPAGLEQLKAEAPAYVPWAWGINGIFSVLAPVLAVGVSMTWGMGTLLLSALPAYLVAALALPRAAQRM